MINTDIQQCSFIKKLSFQYNMTLTATWFLSCVTMIPNTGLLLETNTYIKHILKQNWMR